MRRRSSRTDNAAFSRSRYALVAAGAVGCLLLAGCSNRTPTSSETAAVATVNASVDDATCASCHEDVYLSYKETGMGASISVFDPDTAPESFDAEPIFNASSQTYYLPQVRGDTLFQSSWRVDGDGSRFAEREYAADVVIGSGNATRSYLMKVNGRYTEMPLTWYVDRRKWDLSPGYDQVDQGFGRPITLECMTCHNAIPEHTPFTQNHYEDVPLGISCERCHGKGGAHVERALAGLVEDADTTIVNPARLRRNRQLSVCQQCHLTGITVFGVDEDPTSFRPGMLLAAHRSVFAEVEESEPDALIGIASHGVRLAQSACFQQSAMTCTTCHDPHVPVSTLGPDSFNRACATCHDPDTDATLCSRNVDNPAQRITGDCAGCHMQKSGTSDIPHVTFTDHWIRPVRTGRPPAGPIDFSRLRPEPLKLEPVLTSEAADTSRAGADAEVALAYFQFYETLHRLPAYLDSVVTRARSALGSGAERADLRLTLGRALLEEARDSEATSVLREASELYPADATIAYWYAVALQRGGDMTAAIREIDRCIQIQPLFAEAHLKRGDLLAAAGRPQEAVAAYERVVELDPENIPAAYNNLGFLFMQMNRLDEATSMLQRATVLDPDGAQALLNAASAYIMKGDMETAETHLLRAIEADPANVGAYGNLGLVYAQMGRNADARKMFERLLELQPDDARARLMLQELNGK